MRLFGYSVMCSLCAIFAYFASRSRAEDGSGRAFPIVALGSALLGLWLIVMPAFFVGILMYVLGALLVLGGIGQLMNFISVRKLTGSVPAIFYVIPVLLLLAGILILVNPFEAAKIPFIVLGASSIVYGLTDLFRIIRYRRKSNQVITDVEVIEE